MRKLSPARWALALRRTPPIRTASPTLRQFFTMLLADEIPLMHVAERARKSPSQLQDYRNGRRAPNILILEELAAAAGYRISIERIE